MWKVPPFHSYGRLVCTSFLYILVITTTVSSWADGGHVGTFADSFEGSVKTKFLADIGTHVWPDTSLRFRRYVGIYVYEDVVCMTRP
jgi:hypothetical protein